MNARLDPRRGPHDVSRALKTRCSAFVEELNAWGRSNELRILSQFHVRAPRRQGQVITALDCFRFHERRFLFRIGWWAFRLRGRVGGDGDRYDAHQANAKKFNEPVSHGLHFSIGLEPWQVRKNRKWPVHRPETGSRPPVAASNLSAYNSSR